MLGLLGALIFGGAAAISGIKNAIEDDKCRSRVETLPNGVKYYFDRKGKCRLMNGTLLQRDWGAGCIRWVACPNGAIGQYIVYDEMQHTNPSAKAEAKKNNCLCYAERSERFGQKNNVGMIEFKTNRPIAKIEAKYNYHTDQNEYRKWYWYDSVYEKYKYDPLLSIRTIGNASSTKLGDPGIEITKEEFDELKKEAWELEVVNQWGYGQNPCVTVTDYSNYSCR